VRDGVAEIVARGVCAYREADHAPGFSKPTLATLIHDTEVRHNHPTVRVGLGAQARAQGWMQGRGGGGRGARSTEVDSASSVANCLAREPLRPVRTAQAASSRCVKLEPIVAPPSRAGRAGAFIEGVVLRTAHRRVTPSAMVLPLGGQGGQERYGQQGSRVRLQPLQ
jgi:hypothetical protein